MSRKLAAFVAGFGGGYLKANEKAREDERQAKRDAMADEQFQWAREQAEATRKERQQKDELQRAVTETMSAGTQTQGFGSESSAGKYFSKNASDAQAVADINAAADEMANDAQAGTSASTPPPAVVQPATAVSGLSGRSRLFTGLNSAIEAKKFADENPTTPYAKYMALSERLASMAGGQELADKYLERAKKAEREGAFKTLSLLDAGDTEGALSVWNSSGSLRLQPGQRFESVASGGQKIHRVVNADGSVAVPNVESALIRHLSGIDGVVASAQARQKAALDRESELLKPRTLKPGERLLMPTKDGGFTSVAENPTDRVQIGEDADGNPIYGKPSKYLRGVGQGGADGDGDGTGKKGKGKTPLDLATTSVMDAIKESAESKSLNADQLIGVQATARELVANAARNGQEIDPYVAGKIALTAVLKPESVKPSYDPATGTFESTVAYNGNKFSVGRIDPTMLPESQLKGVAQAFVSKLPTESRGEYIKAASGDKAAVDKINSDIVAAHGKAWADRFRASTGRAPTQQDVQASIARTQAIVGQNIDLVRRSGIVEQAKKDEEKAAVNKERADAQAAIGTPSQIMALPRGEAERIYRQYNRFTDARQREALQMKMAQDRRISPVGGLRQQ